MFPNRLLVLCFAATAALATVSSPVSVSMTAIDDPVAGKQQTIHVALEAAEQQESVHFRVEPSTDWMIKGKDSWSGPMKPGEEVTFTIEAIPLVTAPAPFHARLEAGRWRPTFHALDLRHAGRRTPEIGAAIESGGDGPAIATAPDPRVQPASARSAQVSGVEVEFDGPRQRKSKVGGLAASATISATGRVVFNDDQGRSLALPLATVQLWDKDPAGDDLCGQATTAIDGSFNILGSCSDVGGSDYPDVYIYVTLNSSIADIGPAGVGGTFSFATSVTNDFTGGTKAYGNITVGSTLEQREACNAYRAIVHAWKLMADEAGESVPKVQVALTAIVDQSRYSLGKIHLETGHGFYEDTVIHEYGHHVLGKLAERPAPSYDNGICDGPGFFDNGHCAWRPEKGEVAWTEGWPTFLAYRVLNGLGITTANDTSVRRVTAEEHLHEEYDGPDDFSELRPVGIAIPQPSDINPRVLERHEGDVPVPSQQALGSLSGTSYRKAESRPGGGFTDESSGHDQTWAAIHGHPGSSKRRRRNRPVRLRSVVLPAAERRWRCRGGVFHFQPDARQHGGGRD